MLGNSATLSEVSSIPDRKVELLAEFEKRKRVGVTFLTQGYSVGY